MFKWLKKRKETSKKRTPVKEMNNPTQEEVQKALRYIGYIEQINKQSDEDLPASAMMDATAFAIEFKLDHFHTTILTGYYVGK